jgi:DNA polymerase IV
MPRSSNCWIRPCAASPSPSAAGSCLRLLTKPVVFGIRSGMPGRQARELCPHLIFVGGHFKDYQRLGDAAINVLNDFTPLVERISIDEAFADVAGCSQIHGAETALSRVSGGKAAESQGIFRRRQENGIAQDCVVVEAFRCNRSPPEFP